MAKTTIYMQVFDNSQRQAASLPTYQFLQDELETELVGQTGNNKHDGCQVRHTVPSAICDNYQVSFLFSPRLGQTRLNMFLKDSLNWVSSVSLTIGQGRI